MSRWSQCIAALFVFALIPIATLGATARCPGAIFARGQMLPEPSGSPRVVTVYQLQRTGANGSQPLRLGYAYLATDGASYYQAEPGTVAARDRDAEVALLRAAGFSRPLALQYTHLTEMPAIPPVTGLLRLVAHLGGTAQRCAP